VLLEKPLEITADRSRRMVEAAWNGRQKARHRAAAPLSPGPRSRSRRCSAPAGSARSVSVSARLNNWRPQSYYDQPGRGTKARDGGGVLLTQAIHTLDQMIAMAGIAGLK
jgi:UDP-N-acetyl-2-amino-2-deoxyglucuronate dehydrogenase